MMFKGKWITTEEQRDNLHFIFEKCITLDRFETARIIITADDYYKLKINGRLVGQGPAPAYSFDYKYNEYDITDYLVCGENKITVHCYYQGLTNRVWVSGDNTLGMIADIYVDGKLFCSTDSSWKYRIDRTFTDSDTVGYDTAFLENRDMRAGKTASENAVEIPCPHRFASEPFPALEITEITAKPIQSGNKYTYDFGSEYVCSPIIKAAANADGATLIIRCAEELNEDGSARFDMRCGCRYEEKCILKKGENLIEQYDCKALRYMEIIADEGVTVNEVKLAVRHYPVPEKVQEIHTDNTALKDVFELCKNTALYGTQEVFVDCPTREKGQYLGDAYISGFAHYYLTRDSRMLKKALYDFAGTVKFSGRFLSVAPCAYKQKIADYDLLYPDFLLKYYKLTGDTQTLRELAPICKHILKEYSAFANADGLLNSVTISWNLVDWPENMRDGYEDGAPHNVINAYYIFAVRTMAKINAILGKENAPESDKLKAAFNRVFFSEQSGVYTDCAGGVHSSLHANILPLAFGICEDKNKNIIVEFLLKKGMCCSVYMSYFFLRALCESGCKDKALGFITSDGENSWLNMLREGATTTFEAWGKEQKWNTSLFHPWAVSPVLILNEYFDELL